MKSQTKTNTAPATASDYAEQLKKAQLDREDAITEKINTQYHVIAQETEVKNLELKLAEAKRKLTQLKRAEKTAAQIWTNADHRVKCFETELLMKRPPLTKIDEWVNQLQQESDNLGIHPVVVAREYALERRLTIEDLLDYHSYLAAKTSLTLPKPKWNCYTAKSLALEILNMLNQEETEAIYSCAINPQPTTPADTQTTEDAIDCGF